MTEDNKDCNTKLSLLPRRVVCQSKRPLPLSGGMAGARPTPRRPGPPFARVSAPPLTDKVNAPPVEPGAAFTLSSYPFLCVSFKKRQSRFTNRESLSFCNAESILTPPRRPRAGGFHGAGAFAPSADFAWRAGAFVAGCGFNAE